MSQNSSTTNLRFDQAGITKRKLRNYSSMGSNTCARRAAMLFCGLLPTALFAVWLTGKAATMGSLGTSGLGRGAVSAGYIRLPLQFEANHGQTNPVVKFVGRGPGYTVFLTPREAVLALQSPDASGDATSRMAHATRSRVWEQLEGAVQVEGKQRDTQPIILRLELLGAKFVPTMEGLEPLPGKENYFVGSNAQNWQTDITTYAKVRARNIYPGVDLIYYGAQRRLEYDFIVAPGADPKAIRIAVAGAEIIDLDNQSNLVLRTSSGPVRLQKPVVYQDVSGGRREVTSEYELKGHHRIGFHLGAYDRTKPLVIDPVVDYSTYLGGSGFDEIWGIAADSNGDTYVAGLTTSLDFHTFNPLQSAKAGGTDVFVAKYNSTGSSLVYATYIGGSGSDLGLGIAVDSSGNAYVTGSTDSPNFPSTTSIHPTPSGVDVFVVKLNANGSALLYSTVFGGSGLERGAGIAVDSTGNAYVTGRTTSNNFPLVGAAQGAFGGVVDAFVTKLNATGSALLYSTYLGGTKDDRGFSIAVDATGSAYVTGRTASSDFPTANALQPVFAGGVFAPGIPPIDCFVSKLDPSGSTFAYSTYLGGSGNDVGESIAVDVGGNAYISGATSSSDFPTVNAFQPTFHGGTGVFTGLPLDAWVAKLNASGSALVYSTYLGGSGDEFGNGIAVGADGSVYVAGETTSPDFPTANAPQPTFAGGGEDAFVAKMNPAGSALIYSTYLGSGGDSLDEYAQVIATDAAGNAYVAGSTNSSNFPMVNPFQRTFAGNEDAWIAKIGPSIVPFAALAAQSEITQATGAFELKAQFMLGAASNGIAPVAEVVSFQIGTFSTAIPAGRFRQNAKGRFMFEGTINGVALQANIVSLGGNQFTFYAEGTGANLTGSVNPVPVGLTIGDDDGSVSITATFQ